MAILPVGAQHGGAHLHGMGDVQHHAQPAARALAPAHALQQCKSPSGLLSGAMTCAWSTSMTTRSGLGIVKIWYLTGPLMSKTTRVLSGAGHTRMRSTSTPPAAASAGISAKTSARKRMRLFIFLIDLHMNFYLMRCFFQVDMKNF